MAARKTLKTKRKAQNARVKGRQPKKDSPNQDKNRWLEGIVLILLGVYCYYAFVTAQPSLIDKFVGKFILMYLFGNAVPLLCLIMIGSGILLMLDKLEDYKETITYLILIAFNFMIFLSIYIPNLNLNYKIIDLFDLASYGGYGGIVGITCAFLLNMLFTRVGAVLIVLVLTIVEIFLIFKANFPNIYSKLAASDFGILTLKDKFLDLKDDLDQKKAVRERKKREELRESDTEDLNISLDNIDEFKIDDSESFLKNADFDEPTDFFELVEDKDDLGADELEETDSSDFIVSSLKKNQIGSKDRRNKNTEYSYPSIELLNKSNTRNKVDDKEIRSNAKKIKETLNNFGIDATIRNYEKGPSITRYEVKPAPGVKVSKIVNLADDLALALATSDIRIEAPIPGKDAIGIEVPNKTSDIVQVRELIDSDDFRRTKADLPFTVGKTLSGHNVIGDIASMPHLLIAGSTGSGKSVCINSLIISLLYHESPEDLKMILIDPKIVELSQYNNIPHLLVPVVTDPQKAAGALNWGIQEMEKRYELFSENGVRDLETYNDFITKSGGEKLPRIVIVVDELADLMMTSPKEVEGAICRIAQKARACGIHLVIATQRPSVDVITGLIKSNIPSRIAFAVASNTDSRTIIDSAGAEKLLGKGDMLYKPVGLSKPLRIQCGFVSDSEISRVIDAVKVEEEPVYNEEVSETIEQHSIKQQEEAKETKKDALYEDAIEVCFNNNQISTSMLQRRLGIGYARAGRLIDSLEANGIITGPNGSKPRQLLITREQYYA